MKRLLLCAVFTITALLPEKAHACTGITLRTAGGTPVPARTIEWAGNDLESKYAIVPRGFKQHSLLPDGQPDGMEFVSRYGHSKNTSFIIMQGIHPFMEPIMTPFKKYFCAKG